MRTTKEHKFQSTLTKQIIALGVIGDIIVALGIYFITNMTNLYKNNIRTSSRLTI